MIEIVPASHGLDDVYGQSPSEIDVPTDPPRKTKFEEQRGSPQHSVRPQNSRPGHGEEYSLNQRVQ
ncbi:hypothetical protein, partial [Methylobacterium bullatum]|uniref:hypothetical protein n=1 Tax=Methylobacterium bullatum TaxID=570505 RepID=UPI001EE16C78